MKEKPRISRQKDFLTNWEARGLLRAWIWFGICRLITNASEGVSGFFFSHKPSFADDARKDKTTLLFFCVLKSVNFCPLIIIPQGERLLNWSFVPLDFQLMKQFWGQGYSHPRDSLRAWDFISDLLAMRSYSNILSEIQYRNRLVRKPSLILQFPSSVPNDLRMPVFSFQTSFFRDVL